ncbi:hypothetical protein H04402_02169 [Clostridium botulinum H04402 065]|uniref:hypothetical protein n=1 Tax=Clostridium botulinum TaxID=1491 RepID=UPI0001F851B4|nr:hypothetical protein [Clostridium botulinum]CBZ03977.1 hypothetical protein H04402_02169 [Clostridium botulinum H04402 065]
MHIIHCNNNKISGKNSIWFPRMLRVHAISSSELTSLATKVKEVLELSKRFLTTVAF